MANEIRIDPAASDQLSGLIAEKGDRVEASVASRITWIDVARGLAIILIVAHHARDYVLIAIPVQPGDWIRWAYIDPLLTHIRLPLFFTISGALAFGLGSRQRTTAKLRRTLLLTTIYLLWSLVMLAIIPLWPGDDWYPVGISEVLSVLRGDSVLWYLWALVVAFAVTAITRKLPASIVVAGACLFAMAFGQYHAGSGGVWKQVALYLPLYMAGARYPEALLRLAGSRNSRIIGGLSAIYFLSLNPLIHFPGLEILRNAAGAMFGIVAASLFAAAWPACAERFARLGQRTLPIYVLHFPIIAWLGCALFRMQPAMPRPLGLLIILPVLTAAALTLSLLLWQMFHLMGLSWTLAMSRRQRG